MCTIEHYDKNNNSSTIILQYYSPFAEHDHMYRNNLKKIKHLDTTHNDTNKTS